MNNELTTPATLTMIRNFDSTCEKVFDAWLNTEMMKKWLFTMESTNKIAKNEPNVGGTWEIVDHREGNDYSAVGEYLKIVSPSKLVFTFKMPQFSDLEDEIIVEIKQKKEGCEMTFTQNVLVPHEENWNTEDVKRAIVETKEEMKKGWDYMFEGLKQLVETGSINI